MRDLSALKMLRNENLADLEVSQRADISRARRLYTQGPLRRGVRKGLARIIDRINRRALVLGLRHK